MTELLNTVSQSEPTLKSETKVINWSLNMDTQVFECDQQALMENCEIMAPLTCFEQLFDYMSQEQKEEASIRFSRVKALGGEEFFSCCIVPRPDVFIHIECRFEKINSSYIQGSLIPQIKVKGQQEQAKILETIFNLPNVGVLIADSETRILGCNAAFESQMGYQNLDIVGLKTQIFSSELHSQEFYENIWREVETEGVWCGNLLSLNATGGDQAHHLCLYKLALSDDRVFYIGFSTDISAALFRLKSAKETNSHWISYLPNKNEFEKKLNALCADDITNDIKIIMTIAPKFSAQFMVEEQLGFSDFLMRSKHVSVASQLTKNVFSICIQTPKCRWLSPLRLIQIAIRGFFTELRAEVGSEMHDSVVAGRTGVSVIGYDADNPTKAIVQAAQAMVSAKSGIENYFNFYNSDLHTELVKRLQLESILRDQIASRNVDVYFQPIVEARTGRVAKFEALARFHLKARQCNTQEVIAIIEDLELVSALDDLVCQISIEKFPYLQRVYGEDVGLTINRSLNTRLDSLQVIQNSFEIIQSSKVDPRSVTIELTETAYFEQDAEHKMALDQVRQHGISIAIDDFGTGYSSFSYLEDGQFDVLKIDRKFVQNLAEGSTQYSIVKMITQLAHSLNVKVIAEGVETVSELKALSRIGVDYMQGFVFSEALPLSAYDKAISYEHLFEDVQSKPNPNATLLSLCHSNVHHLDPGDPLSLAVEFMNLNPDSPLVVVDEKQCVGVVLRDHISLHLTPSMGTDLETEREARVWKKPVNQVMSTKFQSVEASTQLKNIPELLQADIAFPWVVCDEKHHYRGVITQGDVLHYLANS
ncbi:EAL domain-containing protein [Vibrio rotiferianus]|uniref:EAL domain-containing protein n=1 Tax=Vibrio rotiferianus TaxID=190895 RepID=UPI00406A6CC8